MQLADLWEADRRRQHELDLLLYAAALRIAESAPRPDDQHTDGGHAPGADTR
jgi:hypothetical protein